MAGSIDYWCRWCLCRWCVGSFPKLGGQCDIVESIDYCKDGEGLQGWGGVLGMGRGSGCDGEEVTVCG